MEYYWKIYKPRDLLDCFKPLLYTGKILLALPYHITPTNHLDSSATLEWIVFLAAMLNLTWYFYTQILKPELSNHPDNPFVILSTIRFFLTTIYWLTNTIKNKLNHKHVVKIFEKFQNLEKLYHIPTSDLRQMHFKSVMITIILWMINLVTTIIIIVTFDQYWANILLILQFIHGFTVLNLSEIYIIEGFAIISKFVDIAQNDFRNFKKFYKRKQNNKSIVIDIIPKDDLTNIFGMKLAYRELLDTKELINDVFSFQMLTTTAYIFVETVFFAFLNVVVLQKDLTAYNNVSFCLLLTYTIFLITKFDLITTVSHNLTAKLKNTGRIIFDLLSEPQQSAVKDEVSIQLRRA